MGGIETHLGILCRRLKNDVDVEAIVFGATPATVNEDVDGIAVTRCGELLRIAGNSVSSAMSAEISRRNFDILHLHAPNPAAVAAYLVSKKPKRHRLVITHHSDIVRQRWLRTLASPVINCAMRKASAIIATSPNYLASSLELRAYRSKCVVIPYGIDLERLTPTQVELHEAERIRSEVPGPIVLAIGRLIYYKGFDLAIRAMQDVPATLFIIGSGPLRESLERLARELGLRERVRFIGEVHNYALLPYYLASDVFLFPSTARSEAFGIVQLEAMACRLPVVNTELETGVPFVSVHLETGLTVPPRAPGALRSALLRLLQFPDERKAFGAKGLARVQKEFTGELMTKRHLELYTRLASEVQ